MRYALLIYADQEPWLQMSEEEAAKASEASLPGWYALMEDLGKADPNMDGKELDGSDAERFHVLQDGRYREAGIGAAQLVRHIRVELREAFHVRLVDHRSVPRRLGTSILSPGERGIDHHALRHRTGTVALVEGEVLLGIADLVAVHGVVPSDRPADRSGIRVEEQLVGVEPMPFARLVGPVDPIAVEAPRPHVGQVDVPVDRHKLHLRTCHRHNLAHPEQPKVSVPQGRESRMFITLGFDCRQKLSYALAYDSLSLRK